MCHAGNMIRHPSIFNNTTGKSIVGAHFIQDFISKLKKPRRIMLNPALSALPSLDQLRPSQGTEIHMQALLNLMNLWARSKFSN